MKQEPKTKNTPVFLFFGAQGFEKEKLFNVNGELRSIRNLIVNEFGSKVECQTSTKTDANELIETIEAYRNRTIFIHFAGHGGGGEVQVDDFPISSKNLVNLIQPNYAKSLEFVFLNACNTNTLVPALLKAGVKRVIATNAGVNDELAAEFAKKFYSEFLINKLSFLDAFNAANAVIDIKGGKLAIRGVGYKKKKNDFFWGLYENTNEDFSIEDILQEPSKISNTQANKPIKIDKLICQLNRSKLDDTLAKIRGNFPQNKNNVGLNNDFFSAPLVLSDNYIHAPHLYVKKISHHFGFKKIGYNFPLNQSQNLNQELAISINRDLIKEEIKADPSKGVRMLLSKYKQSNLLLFTEVQKNSKIIQVLKRHHQFWENIEVPGKNILSLISIRRENKKNDTFLAKYFSASTEKKLNKWNEQQAFFFPNMENISIIERTEWEEEIEDKYPQLGIVFQNKKYRQKVKEIGKPIPLKTIYDLVKKVYYSI